MSTYVFQVELQLLGINHLSYQFYATNPEKVESLAGGVSVYFRTGDRSSFYSFYEGSLILASSKLRKILIVSLFLTNQ